jgi:hypothetical protein
MRFRLRLRNHARTFPPPSTTFFGPTSASISKQKDKPGSNVASCSTERLTPRTAYTHPPVPDRSLACLPCYLNPILSHPRRTHVLYHASTSLAGSSPGRHSLRSHCRTKVNAIRDPRELVRAIALLCFVERKEKGGRQLA